MKQDTLIEVMDKLIGSCYPYGDTTIDEERYKNLEMKIAVVDHLLYEIKDAGRLYDRPEFSIQHISNKANEYLTNMRDWLLEIEYLPPIEQFDSEVEE